MNRTLTSLGIVARPSLHSSSSRLTHLEAPTPLHRGESSGDLTDFSSTNGALRAVKESETGGYLNDGLT